MKYEKKEMMYEVNVWELKSFALDVANYYRLHQLHTNILLTCCLDQLRVLIKNNPLFHSMILKQLIHCVEIEEDAKAIEQHLVYMRMLLDWNNIHYKRFRESYLEQLKRMANPYLTSDLYVIGRHLLFDPVETMEDLIEFFEVSDDEMQKYFLCEIYLIEEDYKIAYTYLKECRYVGVLQEYDEELRDYSIFKYHKYALKEPLFKFKPLGEQVWMKNQLKY